MKKAPTIKEIARMLNLSISTVSRALHNSEGISEGTTRRVKEVAHELGYEPNQTALFLKSGKTLTLGVILPHLSEAFFSEAISGIEDFASEHNYNVLMGQSHDDTEREKKIVEAMKNHRVDGILVSIAKNTKDFSHFDALQKYDIPVVFFDRVPDRYEANTVTCKMEAGMLEAIEFLVKRGHTRIAFINGPKELLATRERLAGYDSALRSLHVEVKPEFVVHSDLSPEATCRAMQTLLTLKTGPSAVIAFNDYVALDAMQYARKMNIRINQDISFVSFANLPVWSYMENPPLASVEQFPYRQGQRATEMILEILNTPKHKVTDKFKKIILEPRLFIHT
ncbi:LacI family DNA-binding transcriptional regulator [Chryseolinea lacunae]|uniref:LacI family DNA-binding transcriptional regulator n=1 Tax=Chryseolinea lacunae TaxID=2801331 RepID=A0ABS1KPB6_9BACT|nr:LacI family DNA-binding transcriptional regulator [Chryseolinea lacunae]MBL0741199.1 LacI family DNA-binding transcriptional regulator [Chryseolinea lacunae]